MGSIAVGSTERAGISSEDRAGHFAIGVLEVVRSIETLALSIVATENADLQEEVQV